MTLSERSALKRRTARQRADLWKRVGAFVRVRREELGLSQGEIIRVLGYQRRLREQGEEYATLAHAAPRRKPKS